MENFFYVKVNWGLFYFSNIVIYVIFLRVYLVYIYILLFLLFYSDIGVNVDDYIFYFFSVY